MSTKSAFPFYVRLADLAQEAKRHPLLIEKYIYLGVLVPDAELKHGRARKPIFLKSRLPEHVKAIRAYLANSLVESVG